MQEKVAQLRKRLVTRQALLEISNNPQTDAYVAIAKDHKTRDAIFDKAE